MNLFTDATFMETISAILIAAFSAVSAITIAIVSYMKVCKSLQAEELMRREMDFQEASLTWEDYLHEWGDIDRELKDLFASTSLDRFLLLRAWNGLEDPKWTTALLQVREQDQHAYSYVHFELDSDYVARLNMIKSRGYICFKTEHLPDSAIKRVYALEGVTSSSWHFISRKRLAGSESASITYCSFATHGDGEIDENTLTRCRLLVDKIRALNTGKHDA